MPYWCPECSEEITHLNYRADVVEYGSYSIRNGDTDCNDTDTNNMDYSCPECDSNIDTGDVLIENPNEEDEEKEKPPKDTTKVVKVFNDNMFSEGRYGRDIKIMKCKCGHMFEVNDNESETECVKCETPLTKKNLITV